MLFDPFNRQINYIRISVTDRCDLRCRYCMNEHMEFLPREHVLTLEEIARLAKVFVKAGVQKIRITGGEPLVRKGVIGLLESLNHLKAQGLKELVLTTNATTLEQHAEALYKSGVSRINISLDTLNAERFRAISRTGSLERVLTGIEAARAQPFQAIKLNSVLMKDVNEDEVLSLVTYAIERSLDISFIEEMPLGQIDSHERQYSFVSSHEIESQIRRHFTLQEIEPPSGNHDGPARKFFLEGTSTTLGLISPHSHNFCASCNRVRLTAEGRLLLCLGNEHSMDFKHLLREQNYSDEQLSQTFINSLGLKPEKHEFDLSNEPQIVRFMNMTGG